MKGSALAVDNEVGSSFVNDGDFQIIRCATGILNKGTFRNEDKIKIDSINVLGIDNLDDLTNANSATIHITNKYLTAGAALRTQNNGLTTNDGTIVIQDLENGVIVWGDLTNKDSIYIKDMDIHPVVNLGGVITNESNGKIIICGNTDLNTPGLTNAQGSTIHNDGLITIDSVSSNGVQNQGVINLAGEISIHNLEADLVKNEGNINIASTGKLILTNALDSSNAISNLDTGIISNAGLIVIDSISAIAFMNEGVFTNEDSLVISRTANSSVLNQGRFINNGYCDISYSKGGNASILSTSSYAVENNSSIINSGVFEIRNCWDGAIRNYDTLVNLTAGMIDINNITGSSGNGIYTDGIYHNHGTAHITECEQTGLQTEETFQNFGILDISKTRYGIINFGAFFNETIGQLFVGESLEFSLANSAQMINRGMIDLVGPGTKLFNQGKFENYDSLTVSQGTSRGIQNRDTLINYGMGVILVDSTKSPLHNENFLGPDAYLGNYGMILLKNGHTGIRTEAKLENDGTIDIRDMSVRGILDPA